MFSVIIPSRNSANLLPCVASVQQAEPNAEIIVIDDGLDTIPEGVRVIPGIKPFCFARNMNLGIAACGNDVVLLNDDAMLTTAGGFAAIEQLTHEQPEYGIISPVTNLAGNAAQYPQGIGLRDENRVVAFVCVYIPRTTIERVGLLDERFQKCYGGEDNDYCKRVLDAGLKIGIFDGCFVDHASLHSTFRGAPTASGDIGAAEQMFRDKWGVGFQWQS